MKKQGKVMEKFSLEELKQDMRKSPYLLEEVEKLDYLKKYELNLLREIAIKNGYDSIQYIKEQSEDLQILSIDCRYLQIPCVGIDKIILENLINPSNKVLKYLENKDIVK